MSSVSATPNFSHGFPGPGPQQPTPHDVMDQVFFLSETAWQDVRECQQFDFIIIGSGVCGTAVAERVLSKDPSARILMLERGPFFLPEHFQNLPLPYEATLGGLSETFPWTLSARMADQPADQIAFWQHGMVPFVGGRSIMWSSWCPRPTSEEMAAWPREVIDVATTYFESAEFFLNVIAADRIDADPHEEVLKARVVGGRPIYAEMQARLQALLQANLGRVESATRTFAAPLAVGAGSGEGLDFAKFSTPSVLLDIRQRQVDNVGAPLQIATECIVTRIRQQDGRATALETSRGMVSVGDAQVILAMGTLPPTTLVLNSFPQVPSAGARFTAHFITALVGRIPRADFPFGDRLAELELAAIYMAGADQVSGMQYHVQLSVLSDRKPSKNAQRAARYAPDVVATASRQQLAGSEDYLVFVCAVLGELDARNADNHLRRNDDADPTTNVTLQALANDIDRATWDTMDEGTFQMLELALSPEGPGAVEYWHADPSRAGAGTWRKQRPSIDQRRVPGLVHEGSTLWIGTDDQSPVGLDYRPRGVDNVYVTGGALWPAAGSWNPTMTMVALAQDLADRLVARATRGRPR